MQPVLFLSHGSEENFLKNAPFNVFINKLSQKLNLRKPDIIVNISSLWQTDNLIIGTNLKKETIFNPELHNLGNRKIQYPAPNAIIFSKKLEYYLGKHEIKVDVQHHAFDFGTWGLLAKLFPDADVPVIQMSMPKDYDLQSYFHLGKLLQPYSQKNILIIVSGGLIYNKENHLKFIKESSHPSQDYLEPAVSWINECLIDNRLNDLFDYERKLPFFNELLNSKDLNHLNSLFIALGASNPSGLKRLHYSFDKMLSYECLMSKSLLNSH